MKVVRPTFAAFFYVLVDIFFLTFAIQHDAALFGLVFSCVSFSLLFDMDVMIPKSSLFAL